MTTTITTTTATTEATINNNLDKTITSATSTQGLYSTSTNENEVSPSETSNEHDKEEKYFKNIVFFVILKSTVFF